jgi:hypothetical protein
VHRRRKRARRHWRVSDDAHRSAILLTYSRRALRAEPSDRASGPDHITQAGGARPPRRPPRTANDPRPHRRSLDPGSMVPDVAVSFLGTHTGSQCRRAAAAERAVRSPAQPRGWCPVSLEFPARLRPAGRTETLTERIHR